MSHADKMTNLFIATFMTKILQKYKQIAKSLAPCFLINQLLETCKCADLRNILQLPELRNAP